MGDGDGVPERSACCLFVQELALRAARFACKGAGAGGLAWPRPETLQVAEAVWALTSLLMT